MSATKDVVVNLGTKSFSIDLGTETVIVNVQTIGPVKIAPTTPSGFTETGQVNCGDLGILYIYVQVVIP